jgi:sugar transferase (PEP-CTERM/EpsH1 system associated)
VLRNLLFLAHRLPYPPNKGDKIRSYHLIRFLAERYRVYLGAFIDDKHDLKYADVMRKWCTEVKLVELHPNMAKLGSLRGLFTGEPLTLPYYRNAGLARWVRETIARHQIECSVAYSSAMAQFIDKHAGVRLMDMVDVDSDKWAQYAPTKSWPLSWLYRREARKLGEWECAVARSFDSTVLVSEREARHLASMAPDAGNRIDWYDNGVDADYFQPDERRPSPYPENVVAIVFTGAMDYWPNIDAVTWFAREIFPLIREHIPVSHFAIVGSNPGEPVKELAGVPGVMVTGRVEDVRPYIQHADCVVAPLRLARGVQNKVLEAMAMARPVVTTPHGAEGINAQVGTELVVAEDARHFASEVVRICQKKEEIMGQKGRARILQAYDWETNLSRILPYLDKSNSRKVHENSSFPS